MEPPRPASAWQTHRRSSAPRRTQGSEWQSSLQHPPASRWMGGFLEQKWMGEVDRINECVE